MIHVLTPLGLQLFLSHLNQRLKWDIVIARHLSIHPPGVNFSHFQLFLQNQLIKGSKSQKLGSYFRSIDHVHVWYLYLNFNFIFQVINLQYTSLNETHVLLGHKSRRLQWPIVITRWPSSVVCSSSIRRLLDNLHFLLLNNRLMDFYETWYA